MLRDYEDYTLDAMYATNDMASEVCNILSIGDSNARLGMTELKIMHMYLVYLAYLQKYPSRVTQVKMSDVCDSINRLTNNFGTIDVTTIS